MEVDAIPAPWSAATLLDLHDAGRGRGPVVRALVVLDHTATPPFAEGWGRLPLAERDVELARVRVANFGAEVDCESRCPRCAEGVELVVDLTDLLAAAEGRLVEPTPVEQDGYRVQVRRPDSEDLAWAIGGPDPRRGLIERCVVRAERDGDGLPPERLPPAVVEALSTELSSVAPLSDVRVRLTCPACAHDWADPFDVEAVLWADVERAAVRLLDDVVVLARAFGWREADVLALSAERRRHYVERALE